MISKIIKNEIFKNKTFLQADIFNYIVNDCVFINCVFNNCYISYSNIVNTRFSNCSFDNIKMRDNSITDINLTNCIITNSDFGGETFIKTIIVESEIRNCCFIDSKLLNQTGFYDNFITNTTFNKATCIDIFMRNNYMSFVSFNYTTFINIKFQCNLVNNLTFINAELVKSDFTESVFKNTKISEALVIDCDLFIATTETEIFLSDKLSNDQTIIYCLDNNTIYLNKIKCDLQTFSNIINSLYTDGNDEICIKLRKFILQAKLLKKHNSK